MKTILTITAILLSFSATSSTSPEIEQRYSTNGYPYNLLIKRAQSIKIFYTETGPDIRCSVRMEYQDKTLESTKIETQKKDFEEAPLASCLARKEAKLFLAKTF